MLGSAEGKHDSRVNAPCITFLLRIYFAVLRFGTIAKVNRIARCNAKVVHTTGYQAGFWLFSADYIYDSNSPNKVLVAQVHSDPFLNHLIDHGDGIPNSG